MKKPSFIWALLSLSVVLVVSALAWQTLRLLSMEKAQAVAEALADIEENSRLALSRIDSAAANLLIVENRRSISEFRSFSEKGEASALLTEELEFMQLHFEMDTQKNVTSPQVVSDSEKQLALVVGAEEGLLENAGKRLEILRLMLIEPSGQIDEYTDQFSNIENSTAQDKTVWSAPKKEVFEKQLGNIRGATPSYKKTKDYQSARNYVEKESRAQSVSKALSKATQEVESEYKLKQKGRMDSSVADKTDELQKVLLSHQSRDELYVKLDDDSAGLDSVYPMQPIWVNDELLLVRKVTLQNEIRYQGGWLKTQELRVYFESLIKDLLPNSRLEPVRLASSESAFVDDAMSLVSLPFRLVPNVSLQPERSSWSPMRSSLLVSWLAALVSIAAVALLIKSILRLSERRASFVSAVTHELRTPLTTFRLYSEMLSEGMVKDEAKKKQYLVTMKDEADRLSHLVENVLSYSEIEQGSARVSQENLSAGVMLDRITGRLTDRVKAEGAKYDLENNCEDIQLRTDVTAVEQILFNLVDNACKYGLPEEGEGRVSLTVDSAGKKEIVIRVIDEGRGINQSEKNRLFKAFHKSDLDAANDKPGVGLGLSLCRRTAKQLGGSLTLEKNKDKGAVFALRLPVA